jgi:hypothetical protein
MVTGRSTALPPCMPRLLNALPVCGHARLRARHARHGTAGNRLELDADRWKLRQENTTGGGGGSRHSDRAIFTRQLHAK